MARPLRISYPNAFYHVTCRGNDRRVIFRDDHDRTRFLERLRSARDIFGVRVHAYVLMSNHFHLIVETPKANLSEFMRQFNIAFTGYFNRLHRRIGHLYQGRFKAIVVDKDSYLLELSRYVHSISGSDRRNFLISRQKIAKKASLKSLEARFLARKATSKIRLCHGKKIEAHTSNPKLSCFSFGSGLDRDVAD